MLIDFSVTNYRSIKDKQTFSMQPIKRIDELPDHVIQNGKTSALSSAIIYGRNASGKSNLLKAMEALVVMVKDEYRVRQRIYKYTPYIFDKNTFDQSIKIEIDFIAENSIKYSYKVEFSDVEIIREALFSYPNNRETKLFIREVNSQIEFGNYFKGRKKDIEETLYPNQLLLSKVGTYKIESLYFAYHYISEKILQIGVDENEDFDLHLDNVLQDKDENFKKNLEKLLSIGDTNIVSIKEEKRENEGADLMAEHNLFDNNIIVNTGFINAVFESAGTRKLIVVGSKILDVLENGSILIIDELDKGFHSILTRAIINLFHNPKTNPKGAQLIFATHDVSLLDNDLFRRDQIWFSEKGEDGASTYYSLADLKGIRAGVPLEKYYLKGAFGATPVINTYDLVFNFGEKNGQK